MPSTPFNIHVCLTSAASNHPHLRSLPVTVPFSWPTEARCLPTLSLTSSVGNGPSPTLVVYALTIPKTVLTLFAETPEPIDAAGAKVFEEVT